MHSREERGVGERSQWGRLVSSSSEEHQQQKHSNEPHVCVQMASVYVSAPFCARVGEDLTEK